MGRLLADYRYSAERLRAGLFRCSAANGPPGDNAAFNLHLQEVVSIDAEQPRSSLGLWEHLQPCVSSKLGSLARRTALLDSYTPDLACERLIAAFEWEAVRRHRA